jgi:hypothetical protein
VVVQTKEVTFKRGDSETVIFDVTSGTAGEHTVDINGLLSTFEVKVPEAPPTPAPVSAVPPLPASFTISDLSVTPSEVNTEERVTIGVTVSNTGELLGTYELVLRVDGQVTDTKEVILTGQRSRQVMFILHMDTAGSYLISIDDMSGLLTVNPQLPPATPVEPPAEPAQQPEPPAAPLSISTWIIIAISAAGLIWGVSLMFIIRLKLQ